MTSLSILLAWTRKSVRRANFKSKDRNQTFNPLVTGSLREGRLSINLLYCHPDFVRCYVQRAEALEPEACAAPVLGETL